MSNEVDQVLDPYSKVLFSGSPEQVHKWLKERPLFREGVKIHVGKSMKIMGSLEYLEEKPPSSDGKLFTEDEVKLIVRAEIKRVLGALAQESVRASWSYPKDGSIAESLGEMYGVFFRESELLDHELDCKKRNKNVRTACSCGVEVPE